MDMSALLPTLLSTENPLLPSLTSMRAALHLEWAIVLGSAALLMAGKLPRPFRLGLSLLVMLWTLVPGAASPAYWLGLAFQTPSLMSAVICLAWFFGRARQVPGPVVSLTGRRVHVAQIMGGLGIVLGWVLLLDTFAWLPVSVYAWGFSSAAFGVVAAFAILLWVVLGPADANRMLPGLAGPVLILFVLIVFVVTRWPTGNVWDALIDPWLWVALQAGWLISAARRRVATSCLPPATRV